MPSSRRLYQLSDHRNSLEVWRTFLLNICVCKRLEQDDAKLKSEVPQLRIPNNEDRGTMIGNRLPVDEAYHTKPLQSY